MQIMNNSQIKNVECRIENYLTNSLNSLNSLLNNKLCELCVTKTNSKFKTQNSKLNETVAINSKFKTQNSKLIIGVIRWLFKKLCVLCVKLCELCETKTNSKLILNSKFSILN